MRTNDPARSTLAPESSKAWRGPDIDAPAGEGKEPPENRPQPDTLFHWRAVS